MDSLNSDGSGALALEPRHASWFAPAADGLLRDLGILGFSEPFTNLLTQGMVLNEVFFRKPASGRIVYYNPADVDVQVDDVGGSGDSYCSLTGASTERVDTRVLQAVFAFERGSRPIYVGQQMDLFIEE